MPRLEQSRYGLFAAWFVFEPLMCLCAVCATGAVSFGPVDAAMHFRSVHLTLPFIKENSLQGDEGVLHHLLEAGYPFALHVKSPASALLYVAFQPDGQRVLVIVERPNQVSRGTLRDAHALTGCNRSLGMGGLKAILGVEPGCGYQPQLSPGAVDTGHYEVALHPHGYNRTDLPRAAARLARVTMQIMFAHWRMGRVELFQLPEDVASPAGYVTGPTAGQLPTAISMVLSQLLENSAMFNWPAPLTSVVGADNLTTVHVWAKLFLTQRERFDAIWNASVLQDADDESVVAGVVRFSQPKMLAYLSHFARMRVVHDAAPADRRELAELAAGRARPLPASGDQDGDGEDAGVDGDEKDDDDAEVPPEGDADVRRGRAVCFSGGLVVCVHSPLCVVWLCGWLGRWMSGQVVAVAHLGPTAPELNVTWPQMLDLVRQDPLLPMTDPHLTVHMQPVPVPAGQRADLQVDSDRTALYIRLMTRDGDARPWYSAQSKQLVSDWVCFQRDLLAGRDTAGPAYCATLPQATRVVSPVHGSIDDLWEKVVLNLKPACVSVVFDPRSHASGLTCSLFCRWEDYDSPWPDKVRYLFPDWVGLKNKEMRRSVKLGDFSMHAGPLWQAQVSQTLLCLPGLFPLLPSRVRPSPQRTDQALHP